MSVKTLNHVYNKNIHFAAFEKSQSRKMAVSLRPFRYNGTERNCCLSPESII
jgi:hypothetical protein